jgi:hypothetical protein
MLNGNRINVTREKDKEKWEEKKKRERGARELKWVGKGWIRSARPMLRCPYYRSSV